MNPAGFATPADIERLEARALRAERAILALQADRDTLIQALAQLEQRVDQLWRERTT